MSWIRTTVKTVHLVVLLLFCGLGFYNLSARSEQSPSSGQKNDNPGALTVVHTEENDEDGVVEVEDAEKEIAIENPEPFIPTKEWQKVKPGQAIPRGLHVRLNIQTGEREARLLQDEEVTDTDQGTTQVGDQKYTLDELKDAVKAMKPEKVRPVDMEALKKDNDFRSYEELKNDFEAMNAAFKTDSEVVTELVEQFRVVSPVDEDVTDLLSQLEYYLHQIDNAMLFCDLGAMPMLLRCLNNTQENVRSEAALTLGSALQSNPKVQIAAIENGAMNELLRLLAIDSSMAVRKRAMYALSTMVRHFPFAQKRFLELGGLSVLARLFENKSAYNLQVRAVTLLADLVKEKSLHTKHSSLDDSVQKERLRQYQDGETVGIMHRTVLQVELETAALIVLFPGGVSVDSDGELHSPLHSFCIGLLAGGTLTLNATAGVKRRWAGSHQVVVPVLMNKYLHEYLALGCISETDDVLRLRAETGATRFKAFACLVSSQGLWEVFTDVT
ncbi:hypothetical protein BaRGS_00000082, partial [Batillaria attramentaria]